MLSKSFLKLVNEVKKSIKELTIPQFEQLLKSNKNCYTIDVREESEWQQGHIPNAIHLSKGIIERDIESLVSDTKKHIILYCGGGFRSALAAENLQRMGYDNVFSLAGGFREWSKK